MQVKIYIITLRGPRLLGYLRGPTEEKSHNMRYALINTMQALPSTVGTIESTHNTYAAARKAERRLQARIKRRSGATSYLPTVIIRITVRQAHGQLDKRNTQPVDELVIREYENGNTNY